MASALRDSPLRQILLRIHLRGFGQSKEGPQAVRSDYGSPLDLLAAVHYLRANGAKKVSIVGASMGGDVTERTLAAANPGEIDRVVLLAHGASSPPQKLTGRNCSS